MRLSDLGRRALAWCAVVLLAAAPAAAQEVPGLTFDVTVTTGDSPAAVTQAGSGWIAGKRSRIDLRGPANPAQAMPGMPGENVSVIMHDTTGPLALAMVDHDAKKVMYPSKMLEQIREMMASMPDQPRMTFNVSNVIVDTLGAGETVSGFTTKRYRMKADISIAIDMMGEAMDQTMHLETEGDYAEELSEFIDPLKSSRTFDAFTSGMPFIDSTATVQLNKIAAAVPRGLPLRQVDRMTGVSEDGQPAQGSVTAFSNIKRQTFSLAVFAVPEGYTEVDIPRFPETN